MSNVEIVCKSEYVTMRDNVRLAVSAWLPNDYINMHEKYPAIITSTRYWRAMEFHHDNIVFQKYHRFARYLLSQGYVLIAVDVRGSGASFGCRDTELSSAEVEDIGEVIDWAARQNWCNGLVGTEGTSYSANTALYSLVTAPSALKAAVCRAPDFDPYRHLLAPGGIVNRWFIEVWGDSTCAQDRNDVKALFAGGHLPSPEGGIENVLGVRPVDNDGDQFQLNAAIKAHQANFNVKGKDYKLLFVDRKMFGSHRFFFDPVYQELIENSNVPAVVRCGWHDAGTALGALCMFASFSSPLRVILGPWNHGGNLRVDPFLPGENTDSEVIALEAVYSQTVKSLDKIFKPNTNKKDDTSRSIRLVEYYTLGQNRWKATRQWPLPQTTIKRFYLAENYQLKTFAPTRQKGHDIHRVDPTTGTGLNNRWYTQMAGKAVLFPDRYEADKKLLVYDTPPLEREIEITGHPVVYLYIRSSATDGQFFVYLETVDPDGRVRMLTEGQLRGLHRKTSEDMPPYTMFGPYHSLKEKDALPLVPGEIAEIAFDLFPISVLLKKDQRIRLAIAGADVDVFAPITDCESPEITIERNSVFASCIDLPVIA